QDFIPMGNDPYSGPTGGDISPMQPDVANEYLVMYLSDINASGDPDLVKGHELTQVSTDQEYVTEIFSSVNSTPNVPNLPVQLSNDAILPYITSGMPNFPEETTTSGPSSKPAPVPEPGVLAYFSFGLAGLLLKRRISRRGKVA
ncbi:MAG TPA: PEP-CTERM sorting domain-containing protein, partial [Phycisphaerae bacterium]|nr:PEP-CTERM sorting domain-containing protein [Phycisphaerae bacterium]